MPRFVKMTGLLAATCLLPILAIHAQQPAPTAATAPPKARATAERSTAKTTADAIERIKDEGLKHSQVMATLSFLADVIGPRLTGSPSMKRANEWTRDKLVTWGAANAHLEAWGPFGRGWSLNRFSAQVIEPQCIPLIGFPKAWSPGTDGTLVARVVYFDAKTEADFAAFKGKLKGAIVLTRPVREVAARWEPLAARKTDSELLELADAAEADRGGFDRRGTGQGSRETTSGLIPTGGPETPALTAAGNDRSAGGPASAPASTRGRGSRMSPYERWARYRFYNVSLMNSAEGSVSASPLPGRF